MAGMSKLIPAILLLVLISGCVRARSVSPLPEDASVTSGSPAAVSPQPTAGPTVTLKLTGALIPSQTAAPSATPPPPTTPTRTLGPDDPPYEPAGLKTWLEQAWQTGEPAEVVRSQLEAAGWLGAEPNIMQIGEELQEYSAWLALDMDGDGRDEWLFSPIADTNCGLPDGSLWLVGAPGLLEWKQGDQGDWFSAPLVIDQADFNGDGSIEALAYASDCQDQTSTGAFAIIGLQDGSFTDLISLKNDLFRAADPIRRGSYRVEPDWPGAAITITRPGYQILDATGDGLPDLLLGDGSYGSSEAGLVRPRSETWAWDGLVVSLLGIWWEPSGQRFDALYDANLAQELDDLDEAEGLYLQVLQDDSLLDGVGIASGEENRAAARQFAAFRLELIGMQRGSLSAAQHYRDLLAEAYPDAPLTFAAIQMLEYWRASATPDVSAACRSAVSVLESYEAPTGSLADAGYGLPRLGAGEICPGSEMANK